MYLFLFFIMKFFLVVAMLMSSRLQRNFAYAANDTTTIEIHNPLTAFQKCAKEDTQWLICRGLFQARWYCPTVLEFNSSHVEDIGPCFTCQDIRSDCKTFVIDFCTTHNISKEATYDDDWGHNIADELVSSCQGLCEAGKKGEVCSSGYFDDDDIYHDDSCTPGSHFCDFASDEEFSMNISGTCKACPLDPNECYQDGFVTSIEGKRNCALCKLECDEIGRSRLTVNGKEIPSYPIYYAIQKSYQNVSGPLIDCSILLLVSEDKCPGAEGHICIVDYSILGESEVGNIEPELSNEAEQSGCVAIISIDGFTRHEYDELAIPFITVSEEDRKQVLKSEPSGVAHIEVQLFGSTCYYDNIDCNIRLACSEGNYCYYQRVLVDDEYTEGFCHSCPMFKNGEPDPAGCFFERFNYEDQTESWISQETVESCAKACKATIVSDGCKFCPSEVSALDFGVNDKADQCYFCPSNDVQYPEKIVPLFGKNITCLMIQTFFNRVEVHKDSPNCRLVQSMNYMCGCHGTGYAGANTHTKQVVLVWLPRVSAFVSIAGSMFIIYDTLRTQQKRAKLTNQLLSTLSLFDIIGSSAYALTTLPTPESDKIYGAMGNEQTCTAQGFFIQIGTIACFLNVSLALYYLLTIKYGWTEEKWKRKHAACYLFVPPIVVGLVFAFVGIEHYDNIRLWCNNSAKWWPEIPVILAVIAATGIMGTLCHHVYKIKNQAAQYTSNGTRVSMQVFKQSCWFVAAFYITWVPYLTLQYMWSSGKGYSNYGLILSAAILVPLQGFWNNFVYTRPRYFNKIEFYVFSSSRHLSSIFQRVLKANTTEQLQEYRQHDQLHVVQVYDTEGMNSGDDECNSTNISNKKETGDKKLGTILDPKTHNEDGGGLTGVSVLCEKDAVDTKNKDSY